MSDFLPAAAPAASPDPDESTAYRYLRGALDIAATTGGLTPSAICDLLDRAARVAAGREG